MGLFIKTPKTLMNSPYVPKTFKERFRLNRDEVSCAKGSGGNSSPVYTCAYRIKFE